MLQKNQPDFDVDGANAVLAGASAEVVVRWGWERFGKSMVMSSSFGAQSAVMLHLVTRVVPGVPVVLVDTGYLFPETYQFVEELTERLSLNLHVVTPRVSAARLEATRGPLWTQGAAGHQAYNEMFKVEPMERALEELKASAWLAGLRAEQTEHRAGLKRVEVQDGMAKLHPILPWTRRDVGRYMVKHDLPYHPLVEKGYASIGDTHSTRPLAAGESERDGRFHGLAEECGLHVPKSLGEDESMESAGL
ncbi:MAG: phosphoadenylyl-sulfate reductase [Planctomycetota bacterium]